MNGLLRFMMIGVLLLAGCGFSVLLWAGEPGLQARALLAAQRETVLSSRIPGRVEKLSVKEGAAIREGQVLLTMDCAIHEARRAKVDAELKAARFKLEVQRRLEKLQSGSTLDVGLAQSEVQKVEAELAEMRATVEMCVIRSPFDGRVTALKAGLHQSVAQGVPLIEILDDTSLEIHLIVPSRWLTWLREGTPFTVRLDETGLEYPAKVVRIGARIDPASQSLNVVGGMTGQREGLIAGMSGAALFAAPALP